MRKLTFLTFIAVIIIVLLVVFAFLYIEKTGHEKFLYKIYDAETLTGIITLDKYLTEDKIIFKSLQKNTGLDSYPERSQKLILDKQSKLPLKYANDALGSKGAKETIYLTQEGNLTNCLYLRAPAFFALKEFETGDKTTLFSPYDLTLYMPVFELYNFWKKGVQFFEIIIPVHEAMPVMRGKLEIKYDGDKFISISGQKIETERFILRSSSFSPVYVYIDKHVKIPVLIESLTSGIKFELVYSTKKSRSLLDLLNKNRTSDSVPEPVLEFETPDLVPEEVFFESNNLVLSGELFRPVEGSPNGVLIFIPKDGPFKNGEEYFSKSLVSTLLDKGVAVFSFDYPGQNKSQGNFRELDDDVKIDIAKAAVNFIVKTKLPNINNVILCGYSGGGYTAVKAADKNPMVNSCIILGESLKPSVGNPNRSITVEDLQKILYSHGFGEFDEGYMQTIKAIINSEIDHIMRTNEDFIFFLGRKLPLKAYRQYLKRNIYDALLNTNKPLLVVCGKDEPEFDVERTKNLEAMLAQNNPDSRVVTVRVLGKYLGKITIKDGKPSFEINQDISQILQNWVIKTK